MTDKTQGGQNINVIFFLQSKISLTAKSTFLVKFKSRYKNDHKMAL